MRVASRVQVITEILERYDELVDPLNGGSGVPGDGGSVALMPRTYTASVREVERLVVVLREADRPLWWHLNERYIRCSTVTRDVPVRRRGKHGRHVTIYERRPVKVWHPGVDEVLVRAGVAWIGGHWGLPHEPMLPGELLVA